MYSSSRATSTFSPKSDYLSSRLLGSPLARKRSTSTLPRYSTVRRCRPLSESILVAVPSRDCWSSNRSDHLRKNEIPLCTLEDLLFLIRDSRGRYVLPTDPWNEVYPNIYLSDAPTALCTGLLRRLGVTHVVNAAQGRDRGLVNTWPGYYSASDIAFLGVPAFDNIVFRISPYFEEAADFIDRALKNGGRVLVHCQAGISRSATLVLAFLMLRRGLTAQQAVKEVRSRREIIPNDGFLRQLCTLNQHLHEKTSSKPDLVA